MQRPTLLTGIAALVLVAGGAAYLLLPSSEIDPLEPARRDVHPMQHAPRERGDALDRRVRRSVAAARAVTVAPPQRVVPALAAAELPDAALPFAEQVDALSALALAGHATAACRLLAGASKCIAQAGARAFSRRLQHNLIDADPGASDELMVRAIAQSDAGGSDDDCNGVDAARVPTPDRYLPLAAARMSTRQRVLLAMMRADGSLVRLPREPDTQVRQGRNSDFIVAQFLADNALRFLEEGVAHADPLALEGLILVHAPGFLPGSINGITLALPDPQRFARHALLMQRVYGDQALGAAVSKMLARTLSTMGPEPRARLQADVDRRALQWRASPAAPGLRLDGPSVGDAMSLCATD